MTSKFSGKFSGKYDIIPGQAYKMCSIGANIMPTIKELAEGCGVTKPTIRSYLQDLDLWDSHVSKGGSTFVVDDYAASAVADAVKGSKKGSEGSQKPSDDFEVVDAYRETIQALRTALRASESQQQALLQQLDTKDEQIRALSERLADAQATIDRLSSRSWLDRLRGRGLPPAKSESQPRFAAK